MMTGMIARFYGLLIAAALIGGSQQDLNAAPLVTQVEIVITFKGEDRTVVFELDEVKTPRTAQNFRKLCKSGFYDGTLFHRVIPGYIVQAGDPLSKESAKRAMWGTGGPGYTLKPEFGNPHLRGSVAMARLGDAVNPGKESSGSQFYVALDRIESLDNEYVVFGQVISGMDVLDEIGNASADQNNTPVNEILIKKTTVKGETSIPPAPAPAPEPEPAPVPSLEPAPTTVTEAPAPPVTTSTPPPAPAPPGMPEETLTDITPGAPTEAVPGNAPEGSLSEGELAKSSEKKAAAQGKTKKQGPLTKFLKRFW